ncbi:MAG: aminotransferase class I/II-fold pyridoxal phosphate-dependent enzyme [Peptoniphilus sp.]|nr:aminotransferase class I/II-fold pyridoxal phosphate-dependent enzyme [Peptoniphilus sp.]MDD7363200.1 aminotransferase class I/II-fold pyridoxal phosphate-dependent enzyme [Bacillota bacterium]MDY6044476.1 aminotransferase class I/II-fold pyridoxal phosphate-dependent enzyme [Peptoniphilus sp.]
MFNFRNDYHDLCHPAVLEKLKTLQEEGNIGYGYDPHCERAADLICDAIGERLPVHFVPGGTAANALALGFRLLPHEAVVSADSGHIVSDEVGAIEAGGHKIVTVETEDGKYDPEKLEEFLNTFGSFHNVLPGIIYLSNATETGRVYTKEELAEIRRVADRHELPVYIDGARMGSALTSEACDLTLSDYPKYADIFSIGGTKNGALYGEALVFGDKRLAEEFIYYQKQRSLLLAKGFALGAQFEALFEDGLFFDIAKTANAMASVLYDKLSEAGYAPMYPLESNQIFVEVEGEKLEKLAEGGQFEVIEKGAKSIVRFVTSYQTRPEEVDALIDILNA